MFTRPLALLARPVLATATRRTLTLTTSTRAIVSSLGPISRLLSRSAISPRLVQQLQQQSRDLTSISTPISSPTTGHRTTLVFSIEDSVGALDAVLRVLSTELGVSLTHIESRPSRTKEFDYDFFVDFEATSLTHIDTVVKRLSDRSTGCPARGVRIATEECMSSTNGLPWFPRKMTDLDSFAGKVLSFGAELDSDHPGFTDPAYRERRKKITENALEYRTGMALPNVQY
ncbi:Biopterin-dependent aromatic amino acid hydroxylase-domain-containing protein, partial [Blastocladiella britannica]